MPKALPDKPIYIYGLDVEKLINLIKCIEENKLTRVSDIVKTCKVSWSVLYKYLLTAEKHGLIKTKITGTLGKRELKITVEPKFYEFTKLVEELIKLWKA